MNCKLFLQLDPVQQAEYMGQLVHVCQSNDTLFTAGKELIQLGIDMKLFDRVKIGSEAINESTDVIN